MNSTHLFVVYKIGASVLQNSGDGSGIHPILTILDFTKSKIRVFSQKNGSEARADSIAQNTAMLVNANRAFHGLDKIFWEAPDVQSVSCAVLSLPLSC